MPTYSSYGLTLRSEIPLPELVEAGPVPTPDVEIVSGPVPWEEAVGEDSVVGQFQDLVRFKVTPGRVTVETLQEVEDVVVRTRLLGEIFATLLRQRGLLVLHACAVEGRGGAVCFIGESGWGKSTLAEAFRRRGYALLTDDVAAIEVGSAGRPLVVPSYPQIRLRQDAASHFSPDGSGLSPIWRNGPKMARTEIEMARGPVPLAAAYFLEPEFAERTSVSDVAAQDAVVRLITHTRARTLIQTNTPGLLAQHLQQCTDFVREVRPRVLERRRSFEALGDVVRAVEADAGVEPLEPDAADGTD